MGHDHGNGDHGTNDPGNEIEFPIHPMRASGQCPETIPGLGQFNLWLGSEFIVLYSQ